MKRFALFTAAFLLATPELRAQEDVPSRPERVESSEKPPSRIRTSLVIGGLGFTAGFWALNAGSSYMFPDQPGFDRLRMPVIGPWQALANNDCNGSCGFINYFNYVYFTFSGLAQAGGLGLVIEALVTPTATPGATPKPRPTPAPGPLAPERAAPPSDQPPPSGTQPPAPSKPLFYLPMPSPVGQSGVGVTFGGLFLPRGAGAPPRATLLGVDTPSTLHLGATRQGLFSMPASALARHAVCLGATGSGKTALCLALLEEAALQGIPILALDPKGDVSNLLLTFPDLAPEQLAPWIDDHTARKAGDRQRAATSEAERWRAGLERSGVALSRVQNFRTSTEIALYTPGSTAGRSLALLGNLRPPRGPRETWGELARTTALALLALAGVDADAGRSREEALLSALLLHAWEEGKSMEVPDLLPAIQRPPIARLGALDLEAYYPAQARFELVIALNHLLATRAHLLEGAPLDIDDLLDQTGGRTKLSILSVAHLAEPERLAFTTALLGGLVGWLRRQPGQSSPRALVFLDEATGYLPPVANPPTKGPLLTLFKQGRAQGLGVVVATQNPADLDYKALSNAGTWFVGRLATSRDRQRVKDALEGSDLGLQGPDLDATLASLEVRHFFCQGFWTDPQIFESRWTMSYLRGPLTLEELRRLSAVSPAIAPTTTGSATSDAPPLAPPGVKQLFAPAVPGQRCEAQVLALLRLGYQDRPRSIEATETLGLALPVPAGLLAPDWSAAKRTDLQPEDLQESPPEGASFAPLPPGAMNGNSIRDWQRLLIAHLSQHEVRAWWWCDETRTPSETGEEEAAFRGRLGPVLAPRIEGDLRAQRKTQDAQLRVAEERLRRAEQALERRKEQAARAKADTAFAAGAALLGGLLGGRGTGKKVVKAVQGATRAKHAENEAGRAEDSVEGCREALARLREEHARQERALRERLRPENIPLERVELRPLKTRIELVYLGLVWIPSGVGAPG